MVENKTHRHRNDCHGKTWITRDTYESYHENTTIKVRTRDGKVTNPEGFILPCTMEELGCDTTSADPYAYTWKNPDNCVLAILRNETTTMIKQGNQYFLTSTDTSATRFLFEVINDPKLYCNKPTYIYPTNHDSLYVALIGGGFDMTTGNNKNHMYSREADSMEYIAPTNGEGSGRLKVHNRWEQQG